MTKSNPFKLLDTVIVIDTGDVGTVIELLPGSGYIPPAYEVEVSDDNGNTLYTKAYLKQELMLAKGNSNE